MSHFRASHHATYCARRSLTSYRPVTHTCSHFGARVRRRHMMRETARACSPRSLNVFTAREPTGLSSRRQLILLALHHMALSRELMNPSQIARGWSPPWSLGFESSTSKSDNHDDQLTFKKHLVMLGGVTLKPPCGEHISQLGNPCWVGSASIHLTGGISQEGEGLMGWWMACF